MTGLEAQVRRMADLAWAAGVLDAQGDFVAYERTREDRGLYTPRIRVRTTRNANGTPGQLVRLKTLLGGSCGLVQVAGGGRHEWQISGAKGVARALDDLLPYLATKARPAQLLRELCREMLEERGRRFEQRALTGKQITIRNQLVEALRNASSQAPKL